MIRYFVVFTSSFRSDRTPCITHETAATRSDEPNATTFCGRKVADAATFEPDDNDLEADCNTCRKLASTKRAQP